MPTVTRTPHTLTLLLFALPTLCLMALSPALAAPLTVTNLNDSGPGSLRQAIADAAAGGTITFQAGLSGAIPLESELGITKILTIEGPGAAVVTVDGQDTVQPFFTDAGRVEIRGLTIANGRGGGFGGGIENAGTLSLSRCVVSNNIAGNDGGGIENSGTLTVTDCVFTGNTAERRFGGAIDNFGGTLTAVNCVFAGNFAGGSGGGILNFGSVFSSTTIIHCTFAGNSAGIAGGGIGRDSGELTLRNSVVWGNAAPTGPGFWSNGATVTVTHSDVQGGWPGAGNLDTNPLFLRNPGTNGPDDYGNLRLRHTSPCLDAGENYAVPAGLLTDLDGKDRFFDGDGSGFAEVDMGAYEFQEWVPVGLTLNPMAVKGGLLVRGGVTLQSPAPAGGVVVALRSDDPAAAEVPMTVTVPRGATGASFSIKTFGVAANTAVAITASRAGAEQSAALTVQKGALAQVLVWGGGVLEGESRQATAVLDGHAPAGGAKVTLANPDGRLTLPAEVIIAQNTRKVTFTVMGKAAATGRGEVKASYDGAQRTASLQVIPLLQTLSSPVGVVGGNPLMLWVVLRAPAPAGGYRVGLLSDDPGALPVPHSATVPAGARSLRVPLQSGGVAALTSVTVRAVSPTDTVVRRQVQVEPAALRSLAGLAGGKAGQAKTLRVSLTGVAPGGGVNVALSSTDPAVALPPAQVTVPAGASSVVFIATLPAGSGGGAVTLEAEANGIRRSFTFTVSP